MFKPFGIGAAGEIFVATGEDAVRISFEHPGVEIYLTPGVANGLGYLLQRAACSVGAFPIGGRRTDKVHARFLQELERLHEQYHEEKAK
jgi:hypothetical protein